MAHYLDRHFGTHRSIHVLHDVRLELGGDRAQMDHVVLHRFGAAIVESKSVSTSVRINAAGEWERSWNGRWQGMPDPLLQGGRQGLLLKRLLASKEADLLDRFAFGLVQGTFGYFAVDAFAAISDEGTIERSSRAQASRALKADAVPDAILATIAGYKKANSLLNLNLKKHLDAPRDYNDGEILRIANFLRTRDLGDEAPKKGVSVPPPTPPSANTRAAAAGDGQVRLLCKHCGAADLEATIGRYGPYGKCRACGKNTSIRRDCPSCTAEMRYERATGGFAGTCGACGRTTTILLGGA